MAKDSKLNDASDDINDFIRKKQNRNVKGPGRTQGKTSAPREDMVEANKLDDNPYQPRMEYDPLDIEHLAGSIKRVGQIQSIMVTPRGGRYTIVAGHQRARAIVYNNETHIRATIREDITDEDLRLIAGIENIRRKNLGVIEEGKVYYDLIKCGYKIKELSEMFGEDETTIGRKKNALRLPEAILDDLRTNKSTNDLLALSTIRQIEDSAQQIKLYEGFLENGREWLKVEVEKLKKFPEHVQEMQSPLKIKGNVLSLNLKKVGADKAKKIEEAIKTILSE